MSWRCGSEGTGWQRQSAGWLAGLATLAAISWAQEAANAPGVPPDVPPPVAAAANPAEAPAEKPRTFQRPVIIPLEGDLTPFSERSFQRRLAEARRRQADLVILEITSPGGYVDVSLEIAEALSRVDWARTVAFVPRQAMSGAAIITLGCDDLIIAPTAQYGDAGLIELSLEEAGFRYAPEKARSALASHVRTLAAGKGRPAALAEAFVDMNLAVFHVRNRQTGQETYLTDHEISSGDHPEQWEKLKPVFEAREKHFLTMDGRRAVEMRMAQALGSTREDLQRHYGWTSPPLVLDHTGVDTTILVLNHPLMTGLILVVGLIALYFEFSMPGTMVGGLVAGLCFAIFFWSRFLGGTAGWLEVILFVAGVVFLIMEFFVIPGFGVAGVVGLLLVIASIVMASQTFVVPHNSRELDTTLGQLGIVAGTAVSFLVLVAIASRYLGAIPVARSLILEVPSAPAAESVALPGKLAGKPPGVGTGYLVAVGEIGTADSPLRPAGKARFGDHFVDVLTDGSFVERGRRVRVLEVAGNRVVVREVSSPESSTS